MSYFPKVVLLFQHELMVACQSDKVAASRAMTQNKLLKDQVEELESAVVHLVSFIFEGRRLKLKVNFISVKCASFFQPNE